MTARQWRRPDGREIRQKGKSMKRRSGWHQRGNAQDRAWKRACKALSAQR